MDLVVKGYELEFVTCPFQYSQRETFTSITQAHHIDKEVCKLQEKRVIRKAAYTEDQFISTIFLTPKADKTYRMIINLKELNQFIEYKHFKMEQFSNAVAMVMPNCYMGSIDLKDAYYSVPLAKSDRKFVRFIWRGQIWEYTCLAMGLSSSPRIFTKLLKPVFSKLRSQGFLSVMYIDDCYIQGYSYEECLENINATVNLLESLGFVINKEKSVMKPSRSVTFLGFIIDSETMVIKLPKSKIDNLRMKIDSIRSKAKVKIRVVSEILGIMNAYSVAVPLGSMYCKRLEIEKIQALKINKGNYDASMNISEKVKCDFDWWYANVNSIKSPIQRAAPSIEMFTDASLKIGWGAVFGNVKTGGPWDSQDLLRFQHINYLELYAVFLAIKSFSEQVRGRHLKLHIDNATAVACINNFGSTHSEVCNDITRDIWQFASDIDLWLTAVHIKGALNTGADTESRKIRDDTEWMLDKHIFQEIISHFTIPDIDLFASRSNYQVDRYVSWHPDPGSFMIDAFTCNWNLFSCSYIFCPFSLIHRAVRKIIDESVEAICIIPDWPTAMWYPLIMKICIKPPLVLPRRKTTLILPHKPDQVHPLFPKLRLLACHVSGKCIHRKGFPKDQFKFL